MPQRQGQTLGGAVLVELALLGRVRTEEGGERHPDEPAPPPEVVGGDRDPRQVTTVS